MGRRRTNRADVEFIDTPYRKPLRLSKRRIALALWATTLAVPIMILDNLPSGGELADVAMADTPPPMQSTVRPTTTTVPSTTTTEATTTTTAQPTTTSTTVKATTTTTAKPTTTTAAAPARQQVSMASTTTTVRRPQTVVSDGSTVQTAIQTHFGDVFDQALRVARCESKLDPNAIGGANNAYYGLFQIGELHKAMVVGMGYSWEQILDPYVNSHVARALYDQSISRGYDGWRPWTCKP